ncbi:MAG TPA: aminoglycoside phosphotransferase family protein [Burkholderiales bacterium]|nr:aminoglycoside phosphotransferase family protein [Burkholderiales bacterium]
MTPQAEFFSFVRPGHPFRPQLDEWLALLRGSEGFARARGMAEKSAVHAEIKGVPAGDGWRADRFYWCYQYSDPADTVSPFRAFTVYFNARRERPETYEFPRDPYLPTMEALLDPGANAFGGDGRELKVLRYVPLRRVTFRLGSGAGQGPVIGKFKRRSKLRESYDRLAAVHRAVSGSGVEFSVAAALGVDEERCLFFQELLPGQDLSETLDERNFEAVLGRLGKVHRQMHALQVPGLPPWRFGNYLEALEQDVRWIAFFLPEREAALRGAWERLRRCPPRVDDDTTAFCHGDFVPSQALDDGGHWSITDFDLAHQGGALLETAKLLACLKYHVPLAKAAFESASAAGDALAADAEEAYLSGYEREQGRPLDRERLLWFRLCAEIHYLALSLKKDTYAPATFDRVTTLVERLAPRFH